MFSPALRHRQKKLAAQAVKRGTDASTAPEREGSGPEATEFQLLMAALGEDLRRLKDIQSTEGKIAAKREMIERFTPHVDATLEAAAESGTAVQDEALSTMMLWRFDIGDFDRGLDIAEHVLRFGLRLPERFKRDPACLIAEEVATAALAANTQGEDFSLPVLQRAEGLTAGFDMPDIARAKLHKALGQQFVREAEAADTADDGAAAGAPFHARAKALEHFRRALALEARIGVKKEITQLTAWLNKHQPETAEQSETEQ